MSNTMRTDEVNKYLRTRDEYAKTDHEIWVNHARQLERELNAASKERDDALMMLGMYRMKSDEQNQRIKRLEEAGDKMFWTLDAEETGSVGKEMWRKAKEAKP